MRHYTYDHGTDETHIVTVSGDGYLNDLENTRRLLRGLSVDKSKHIRERILDDNGDIIDAHWLHWLPSEHKITVLGYWTH